jgi:peptide deformylase
MLEGNTYVTSMLVPFIVQLVRKKLILLTDAVGSHINASVKQVANKMLDKMDEIFGYDLAAPFQDSVVRGARNRRTG